MTASAAARRSGTLARGPPSWKISSTRGHHLARFRRQACSGLTLLQCPVAARPAAPAALHRRETARRRQISPRASMASASATPRVERPVPPRLAVSGRQGCHHEARAQIAVGLQIAGRGAADRRDAPAGRPRWRSAWRPHRPWRRWPPARSPHRRCPSTGCARRARWWRCRAPDPQAAITTRPRSRAVEAPATARRIAFARRQMQRDVAAVVHIGAAQRRRRQHRGQHLFRHRARHGRHRRDENARAMWPPPRAPCAGRRRPAARSPTGRRSRGSSATSSSSMVRKRCPCGAIGELAFAIGPDDQVDGPVLQMQPLAVEPCRR